MHRIKKLIQGHLGALCEGCDIYGSIWNENYGHSSAYSCGLCNGTYNFIYLFVGMFLYNLIMLYSAVNTTMTLVGNYIAINVLYYLKPAAYRLDKKSILIKLFQNWIMITTYVFTF